MEHSFLFQFPIYTTIPFIQTWLQLIDLVKLDTALCSYFDRHKLTKSLTAYPVRLKGAMMQKLGMNAVLWMKNRNLSLTLLNLKLLSHTQNKCTKPEETFVLTDVFMNLERLNLVSDSQQLIVAVLNGISGCSALTDLHVTFKYRVFVPRQWIDIREGILPINLRALSLKDLYDLNSTVFGKLLCPCTNLRELSLVRCDNVTGCGLCVALLGVGQQLQRLTVSKCRKVTRVVAHICALCPSLQALIVESYSFTSSEWRALTANSSSALTSLSLRDIVADCRFYTSFQGKYRLHELRSLSLSTQSHYFPPLDKLAVACTGELTEVDFSGYTDLRCSTVTTLVKQARRLTRMSLSACDHISGYVLDDILAHARALTSLDMSSNTFLTVHTAQLPGGAQNSALTELDLSRCTAVSTFGVLSLLGKCTALRRVLLLGCEHSVNLVDILATAKSEGREVDIVAEKR